MLGFVDFCLGMGNFGSKIANSVNKRDVSGQVDTKLKSLGS